MYYFCYISAYKVEQFLAQLPGELVPDEVSGCDAKETTQQAEGKLGALWNLLSLRATYGHNDKRESHSTRRVHLAEKLVFLLKQLYRLNRVAPLDDFLRNRPNATYDLYYIRCPLHVAKHDDQIALLEATRNKPRIELSCSLRYFSEYADHNVPFAVHSGNYHFFHGKVTPTFDAAIIPIELQESTLIATPLFLAINSASGLVL